MCTHLNGVNGVVGDDSVNIALSFDSAYAMPAAVTLRSVAETVQGPVTFYILDGGIRPDDKQKIEESLPKRADMTLHYIDSQPGHGVGKDRPGEMSPCRPRHLS